MYYKCWKFRMTIEGKHCRSRWDDSIYVFGARLQEAIGFLAMFIHHTLDSYCLFLSTDLQTPQVHQGNNNTPLVLNWLSIKSKVTQTILFIPHPHAECWMIRLHQIRTSCHLGVNRGPATWHSLLERASHSFEQEFWRELETCDMLVFYSHQS